MSQPFYGEALRQRLADNLNAFERRALTGGARQAAVALTVVPLSAAPLSGTDAEATVVLTRRALGLRRHSGQWALPGGRLDAGETVQQAALRELDEEVGLRVDENDVLGLLDDFVTRSDFHITPVVVWGRDWEPRPDPNEVASVHRVPFEELLDNDNLLISEGHESDRPLLALSILDTTVFSPTAAILHQFAEVALLGRSTRVAHYEQPRFAWS